MGSAVSWLFGVSGKKKGYVAALAIVQAAQGGLGVLFALLLRNVVDNAVAGDQGAFWQSVLLVVALVAFQISLSAVNRWLQELAKSSIENLLKRRLTDDVLRKEYSAVSATHTAEWLNRLTNDTTVVANGFVEILPGVVGTVVQLVSAVVMVIVLDTVFAAILVPGGVAMCALAYGFRKVLKRLHKDIQERDGKLRILLQEHIGNLMVIKSYAAEEQSSGAVAKAAEDHKTARMHRNRFSNIANSGLAVAMRGMYLLAVVYCAHGIMAGTVSYGTLVAIMQLVGQIQGPFLSISGYLPRSYAMIASAERLMEVEALADDEPARDAGEVRRLYRESLSALGLRDVRFAYSRDGGRTTRDSSREAGCDADRSAGCDTSRNAGSEASREAEIGAPASAHDAGRSAEVGVAPASAHDASRVNETDGVAPAASNVSRVRDSGAVPVVLDGISIQVGKGEYVAFTGHSGCGKSTALKLLMCMYPLDDGGRYLQTTRGELPLDASWRRLFAYVPQGNALMNGTIREVVSFADPGAAHDETRLRRALEISCAAEFVSDPDRELGERGSGLSEGQAQRLAIARAVFADCPVLLLDEATSALDEATERQLLENLRSLTDKTVIIVTHRKAALSICDRVLHFTESGIQDGWGAYPE